MERLRLQIDVSRDTCPYCKDEVRPNGDNVACKACLAWHHTECWSSFDACSACRATVALRPSEKKKEKGCEHVVQSCQQFACGREATSKIFAKQGVHYCHKHALSQLQNGASVLRAVSVVMLLGALLFGMLGLVVNVEALLGVAVCLPIAALFWVLKVIQNRSIEQEMRDGWRHL